MSLLNGKTALITGGSRGIGKALVSEFLAQGCTGVAFTYLNPNPAIEAFVAELTAAYPEAKILALQSDAGSFAAAQATIDDATKTFGRLDALVLNAGITKDNLLLRMTEEQWDNVLQTNLKSAFNYTKAAAKVFLKQRSGSIIGLGSVVGSGGNAGQANYAASKAGLTGFLKSIAKELGSRNIRANVVEPGFIQTEMTASLPPAELENWLKGIPLNRAGNPQDVADLCVFLASDKSTYITGQVISVCGGMSI